jgi:hypothetical protein
MAIPANKDELIFAIQHDYNKLEAELKSIPVELSHLKELEAHKKNQLMSVHNLVAYLVGWGHLVIKWNERRSANLHLDFPETGYKWNQLGLLAQKFYADYKDEDFVPLQSNLRSTVNSLLEIVDGKSNHELYEIPWYEGYTLGRMIQLNSSSPYKNAHARIRKWKKSKQLK